MRKVDYANVIRIHGVALVMMATMMTSHWKMLADRGNKEITITSRIADRIQDVIAIVLKISANCAKNSTKISLNKT